MNAVGKSVRRFSVSLAVGMVVQAVSAQAAIIATWQGPADGGWGTGTNWDTGAAPNNNATQANIDGTLGGGDTVLLNGQFTVAGLRVAEGFTLRGSTSNDRRLTFGVVTADYVFNNAGTITSNQGLSASLIWGAATYGYANSINTGIIEASGTGSSLQLFVPNGSGRLDLDNTGGTIRTVGQSTLILNPQGIGGMNIKGGSISNSATGTITTIGLAMIDVAFTNAGTVSAKFGTNSRDTGAGIGLFFNGTSSLNNSGTLNFENPTNVTNSSSQSAHYRLAFSGSASATNTGTINVLMSGNPATGGGASSAKMTFTGANATLNNTGTINLISRSTSTAAETALNLVSSGSTLTLSGNGGEVVMQVGTGGSVDRIRIRGESSNNGLINGAGHTIRGAGMLGVNSLAITNNGTINADDAAFAMTIDPNATAFANNGLLRASGAGGLVLIGGTFNNNASGTVRVDSGSTLTLESTATLNNYGKMIVDGTFTRNGTFTMQNGSTLGGNGSIDFALGLNSKTQTLSPGQSPGVLKFGVSQAWSGFTYDWELNDWSAAAPGVNADQIQITGDLNLSAGAGAYELNLISLTANNAPGDIGAGGDGTFADSNRSWTILTTTGTITGFDAADWTIAWSNFAPAFTGNWALDINEDNNALVLSYTAVPEPGTPAFVVGGVLAALGMRRRSRAR